MPLSQYIAIDFETAGYYGHSACALGMTKIVDGGIADQYYSLIRPPSSRVCFTHVHGLRWKDLKNERPFSRVWPEALEFIGDARYFIAHNAPFDRGVLYACCSAFGLKQPEQAFICTLKGARRKVAIKSRALGNLCGYFSIDLNHHHAASDARACALVYLELRKLGLSDMDMLLA